MSDYSFFSAFLIGVAGSVHCIGMCGGVAAAFRAFTPNNSNPWVYTLAYNAGRLLSYTLAGSLTGLIGQMSVTWLPFTLPLLSMISAFMLIALACYLGRWWQGLTRVETLGRGLWRRIQPISQRFIPFKSPVHAFPYGMIWGWLPCGLVYSTLTWSLASGSAKEGALIMAGFGLGTLPALIAASAGADWLMSGLRNQIVRQFFAITLLIYGLLLTFKAFDNIL